VSSPDPLQPPPASPLRWLALAALIAATIAGGSALAFLCDDAFIHFRYAANVCEGRGLVWNAEPFRPVEGAGFLWVLLLAAVRALTGVEPPDAANPLSIVCGVAQLLLLAAAARRMRDRAGDLVPWVVGFAALAAIVANRTFLQWLSSGLDTALANVWLLWWVLHACRGDGDGDGDGARRGARWLATWSLAAALAALTRPDGLPLVAATGAVAAWWLVRGRLAARDVVVGLAPLLLVAAHVVWRRAYYGEWLPNTFFAKVVESWAEAGWRYLGCFALENGAWLWGPVAGAWLGAELRRGPRAVAGALSRHLPAVAAVAVVLFNAGYYAFRVGGDHFEYRVLSPLVPLGVLACVAMAARLTRGAWLPVATAGALALAGGAGWVHLALTSDARAEGIAALTPRVPAPLRPIARWFDRQQAWLFFRYIGLRCNHHAARLDGLRSRFGLDQRFRPRTRFGHAEGPFPVRAESAVGVPGWCLPDCALIDVYGLNDWVVARTPTRLRGPMPVEAVAAIVERADADGDGWLGREELRDALHGVTGARPDDHFGMFFVRLFWAIHAEPGSERVTRAQAVDIARTADAPRRMAHERLPPPGYVEAFEPNVDVDDAGRITVRPRERPMTAERIRAIEAEWAAKVRRGELR
jgi:arabinofuranosyltransferase